MVRALLQANLLPRVVSGSSAGSIGGWAFPFGTGRQHRWASNKLEWHDRLLCAATWVRCPFT